MSILQKSTSYSQTDRRVRFRGSLCVQRSPHSRTLNRLFSWSSWEWPHLPGPSGVCLWEPPMAR
jgi:hypothetical protein